MVTQNTQQCIGPVFFNQGSMEPKSSTKGSTGPLVVSKKINCPRHLRPLDVFSTLLVGPKCICGRGSAPNPAEGTYSAPPDPSWWGGGLLTLPKTPLPAVSFWPQISALLLRSPPPQKTWVPWAIKIAAKSSTSLKRLKSTASDYGVTSCRTNGVGLGRVSSLLAR